MTRKVNNLLLAVGVLLLTTGCAGTAKYMSSEAAFHFPTKKALELPVSVRPYLQLHCTQASDIKYEDTATTNSQCLYISADASLLGSATVNKTVRDEIIRTLLGISDLNCQNFRKRAFANRAGFDYGKKFFQDVSTAISAGTATVSAPLSAALDLTNLVVGKGVDTFNATYYFDSTFQAMEAAIEVERGQRRALIAARQVDDKYLIGDALFDISAYDDACSIKAGLARLKRVADQGREESERRKLEVETAPDSAKLSTYKAQFAR